MKQPKRSAELSPHTESVPPPWESCPAKSKSVKTIRRHALESGAVFEALRRFFQCSEELLPPETLLFAMGHDCGKISPAFLWMIDSAFARRHGIDMPCRNPHHALVSESSFEEFLEEREDRAETIVGWHHGRRSPPLKAHSLDYGGEPWRKRREEFLKWVSGYSAPLPETLPVKSQLLTAGMVCLADWIASDETHFTGDLTDSPFEELKTAAFGILTKIGFRKPEFKPGLSFEDIFPFPPNQSQMKMAEQVTSPGVFLLENTMGAGKTEAALYAAYRLISSGVNRGLFFALPTRLTSNKIHERVNRFLEKASVSGRARLIHGTAWLEAAGGEELAAGAEWFAPAKRALLEPFGVGTVDQALKGVLNVRHFFVRLVGLAGKVVIIDEVHAFDEYMHYLLTHLCRTLMQLNCTVILLSATLPEKRRAELLDLAGQTESGGYPRLTLHTASAVSEITLDVSWRREVKISAVAPESVVEKAVNAAVHGCNVALIANTVGEAQAYFRALRSATESGGFPIALLHSRFPFWRRNEIETVWLDALGKDFPAKRPLGSVLVATQVIEQSVDMDFDLMISEMAPGDLLFQRMGRLWRHERDIRPAAEPEFCWIDRNLRSAGTADEAVLLAGKSGKVYSPFLLCRAERIWNGLARLTLPDDMPSLLEENYRPPESGAPEEERELYRRMKQEAEQKINHARSASQLSLVACLSDSASDNEDAPTRLSEYAQRSLLLVKAISVCGKECALTLSDGTALDFHAEERFDLKKMRILAANTVNVPAWWVGGREDPLPQALAGYWKFDAPLPARIGLAGELSRTDDTRLPMRYDDENGVCYEPYEKPKEEDETVFADW